MSALRICEPDEDGVMQLCPHCHDFPCRCLRDEEEAKECTCDRDLCGVCPEHGYFTGTIGDSASATEIWNETLAYCLAELPEPWLYRSIFGLCTNCGSKDSTRDSDECWPCYHIRRADAEIFAKHGGDV